MSVNVKINQVVAIQGGGQTSMTSHGLGVNEEVCFTLNTVDVHAVVYPLDSMNHWNRPDHHNFPTIQEGPSYTLSKTHHHGVVIINAKNAEESMHQISLSEAAHANHSQSRVSEKEWMTHVVTSHSPISQSLTDIAPDGFCGKTSPAPCHRKEDGTLEVSSGRWMKSGMGMHGECLTLNTSEHPSIRGLCLNDEGVSSLSDVLDAGEVPPRLFLTPKACAGILRRAGRKGRPLPDLLRMALETKAAELQSETPAEPA